jgi:hypothetical protein
MAMVWVVHEVKLLPLFGSGSNPNPEPLLTLVRFDGEFHASCRAGNASHYLLTSNTMRRVYAPLDRQVSYTLRKGCSYAVAVHPTPGDVYAFLRPIATFYLSAIAIYRMPHLPHIFLDSHIATQSSLRIPRLPFHLLLHYHISQG